MTVVIFNCFLKIHKWHSGLNPPSFIVTTRSAEKTRLIQGQNKEIQKLRKEIAALNKKLGKPDRLVVLSV